METPKQSVFSLIVNLKRDKFEFRNSFTEPYWVNDARELHHGNELLDLKEKKKHAN